MSVAGVVSWQVMQKMLPHRLTNEGCYPERYLFEGFPTDDELNDMCGECSPRIVIECSTKLRMNRGLESWSRWGKIPVRTDTQVCLSFATDILQ